MNPHRSSSASTVLSLITFCSCFCSHSKLAREGFCCCCFLLASGVGGETRQLTEKGKSVRQENVILSPLTLQFTSFFILTSRVDLWTQHWAFPRPQVVGPALQANESLDGLFLFLDARRCFCGAFFRRGLIHPVHVRDGPFNERRGSPS